MAWDKFERNGINGITGDRPYDEMALALGKITKAYEDGFGRKPAMEELLFTFERVVGASPANYVSDPEGLRFGTLSIKRDPQRDVDYIDTSLYEAAYTDRTDPGYYLVSRRGPSGPRSNTPVLKVSKMEPQERTMVIEYEPLIDGMTDRQCEALIVRALLGQFSQDFYRGKVDELDLSNTKTQSHRKIPYT